MFKNLEPNVITYNKIKESTKTCNNKINVQHGVKNLGTLCFEPPPPLRKKKKNLHGKSTVQVESDKWIVHSPHQTQFEIKNPPLPPPTSKKLEAPYSMMRFFIGA
jgi:hypothetical protein